SMKNKTTKEVDNKSPQTVKTIPPNVRILVRLLSIIFRMSSDVTRSSVSVSLPSALLILITDITPQSFPA
ncbi:MAG: hypothetical protein ACJ741_08075, partial [Pyrinomonadaceae bacterium]